jgi:hypothetical protein
LLHAKPQVGIAAGRSTPVSVQWNACSLTWITDRGIELTSSLSR